MTKEEGLIKALKEMDKKRVEELEPNSRKLFDSIMEIANSRDRLLEGKQQLIDYLKEKENELQKKVVYYEKQLKGTERNSFYYSFYLKNIHKLNAQRELIKEILSKIERSDKQ